jgi:hypothetical protein
VFGSVGRSRRQPLLAVCQQTVRFSLQLFRVYRLEVLSRGLNATLAESATIRITVGLQMNATLPVVKPRHDLVRRGMHLVKRQSNRD